MLRAVGFPDDNLHPQEELILNLTPHWFRLAPATAALLVSIVFGMFAMFAWDVQALSILAGLALVVSAGWFVSSYVSWISDHFVLTTDRVICRKGVIRRSSIEIPLERINTVFSSQSMFERMIGAGDLAIESASQDGRQSFEDMRKPGWIQNEIYVAMENNENRKFDGLRAGQAPAAAEPTVADQLHQLEDLRQRGVLTQAEFDQKKQELLGKM